MKKFIVYLSIILLSSLYAQTGSFTVGVEGGNSILFGDADFANTLIKPKIGLSGGYYFTDQLTIDLSMGYNQVKTNGIFTEFFPVSLSSRYYILQESSINPFLELGLGTNLGISSQADIIENQGIADHSFILGGLGLDIPVTNNIGLIVNTQYNYINNDYYDNREGNVGPNIKDAYLEIDVGLELNLTTLFSEDQKGKITDAPDEVSQSTSQAPGTIQSTGTDTVYKTKTKIKTDTVYKETAPTTTSNAVDKDSLLALKEKLNKRNRTLQNYEDLLADHNNKINSLIKLLKKKNQRIKELSGEEPGSSQGSRTTSIDPSKLPETAQNSRDQQNANNNRNQGKDVRTRYKQTLQLVYNEKYQSAIQNFQQLLREFPNHRLAGNFIYWTGEAYFALNNYRQAVQQFTKLEQYPNSSKIDDALLMAGKCYKLMGQPAQARRKFEQILNEHPDSEYSQQAKALLRDL